MRAGLLRWSELRDRAGITLRDCQRWCEGDLLHFLAKRPGSGHYRWFAEREVACAVAVRLLVESGYSPFHGAVVHALDAIRRADRLDGMAVVVVVDQHDAHASVVPIDEAVDVALAQQAQMVTLVNGDVLAAA